MLVLNKGKSQCCTEQAYQRNSTGYAPLPDMPDGEYNLYPGTPRQTVKPANFFCHRYKDETPGYYRDYVNLTKINTFAYDSKDAPQQLEKFRKNHGVTTFSKIRVSPITLKIDHTDKTYATTSSPTDVKINYGYGFGCNPNSTTAKARVIIDLRDTGFSIDKDKTTIKNYPYTRRTAETWLHSDQYLTYQCDLMHQLPSVTWTRHCGICIASLYLRNN
ncbi:uncharacterized protein LOC135483873 [Lineus longissimus]|uniref:uncharacterized protein LOC135483873 n=1 Tax=Lineus longissimus TaxID=88925 RepID=UPI00315DC8EF